MQPVLGTRIKVFFFIMLLFFQFHIHVFCSRKSFSDGSGERANRFKDTRLTVRMGIRFLTCPIPLAGAAENPQWIV